MLTNDQMKPNRWLKLHQANKRVNWIIENLQRGRTVAVTTYMRSTRYKAKHAAMFKATKSGAYVQSGKRWECIDFCKIESFA